MLIVVVGIVGCKQDNDAPRTPRQVGRAGAITIRGAGASFPSLIYSQWALRYLKKTRVGLIYRSIGSQAGIEAVTAGKVDFGASEVPLSVAAQQKASLVQFPLVIGGVVAVFNLPGIGAGQLRLTAELLRAIFQGKIRQWNHPAVVAVNPGVALPTREIIPIYRDSSSGTGRLFAQYVAGQPTIQQAERTGVEANGSAQVVDFVKQFKYTLGYVEHTYAVERQLAWAKLKNKSGRFVAPGRAAFKMAVQNGSWRIDAVALTGAAGLDSWPITGASYVLVRTKQADTDRAKQMLAFFHWALTDGRTLSNSAGYVPIPAQHVTTIERRWSEAIRVGSNPIWSSPTSAPAVIEQRRE